MSRSARRFSAVGRGALEVAEELAVGGHHHHVAFAAQRIPVRLQAAVERIELGIAVVCRGVDAPRPRLAFAADPLRVGRAPVAMISVCLRSASALMICDSRSPSPRCVRAMPSKRPLHALVHAGGDFFLQVDALHAHVDELDAELRAASRWRFMNSPVISWRSEITISSSVRPATAFLMPSWMVSPTSVSARPSSPPLVAW